MPLYIVKDGFNLAAKRLSNNGTSFVSLMRLHEEYALFKRELLPFKKGFKEILLKDEDVFFLFKLERSVTDLFSLINDQELKAYEYFKCQVCGKCCQEVPMVFEQEAQEICDKLGIELSDAFTRFSPFNLTKYGAYKVKRNPGCYFLKSTKCSIHDIKPIECLLASCTGEKLISEYARKGLLIY